MTIKTVKEGGVDWVNGDVLDAADLNDTFDVKDSAWYDLNYTVEEGDDAGIIAYSASIWHTDSRETADGGATWTAGGTGENDRVMIRSVSTAANAILCSTSASDAQQTTDSGSTYTDATVDPANVTSIIDGSYPSSTVAVFCGEASSSRNIWYTSNSGVNWSQASSGPSGTGTSKVWSISMYSATHGMAITGDGSVWYTSDGGVNWTDSTFNIGEADATGSEMIAISNTGYIAVNGGRHKGDVTDKIVGFYKGTTAAVGVRVLAITINEGSISNFCRSSSGNIYIVVAMGSTGTAAQATVNTLLFRTKDDGDTWSVKVLGYSAKSTQSIPAYPQTLIEYDTDQLLLKYIDGMIMKINVQGE